MFTARLKNTLVAMTILVELLISTVLFSECDMFAMIAKKGDYISWKSITAGTFNDPIDYFNFLRERSTNTGTKPNIDGYGLIYFPDDGSFTSSTHSWYLTGFDYYYYHGTTYNTSHPNNEALNSAEDWIMDNDTEASIVFGHARQTGSNSGNGSHPFRFTYIGNDQTYTLMHNGTLTGALKNPMYEYLDESGFLDDYPSNWDEFNNYNSVSDWIDSEILFRYLMSFIEDNNGNVVAGVHDALTKESLPNVSNSNIKYMLENLVSYPSTNPYTYTRVANFVLSDGENLYIFRNSPSVGFSYPDHDPWHNLSYEENYSIITVKTLDDLDTRVDQFDLVTIPKYGEPFEIPDFLDIPHSAFISTDITSNQIWDEDKYISSDITISNNAEITLSNSACVKLIGHCNLKIDNAQLNVANNTKLQLYNSSQVLIETDGVLFLNWGSTLTGCTPTTYGATPPGQPAGGEEVIPGDRIIAQNGGIITTSDDYQNPGDIITIGSGLPEGEEQLWDGIFIQSPDNDIDYWFVNCDISWINNLSIEMKDESQNIANLKLYLTDFCDAGQIVARHGHNLFITGEDASSPCNICNNHLTPIVAYDSPVYIQYALIEENGRDEYGGLLNSSCDGVYLNYASGALSQVLNSIIQNNTGCGISTYYDDVKIDYCTIQTNEQHGVLTKDGTFNDLQNTTILNNDCAEYVGCQSSYNWPEKDNTIQDLDGNTGGNDQYILIAYNWDGYEESIDVSDNTINHEGNEDRFYPRYEAFKFVNERSINPESELLQIALVEMKLGNYSNAGTGFQEIISQYPDSYEAAVAIRGLYFIEGYTEQDYTALIDYIDAIQVSEESPLYKAKEDVKTKSYMKDKEYEIAIERLEFIINTSQVPDDVIMAMIDQGYCYMELATLGARFLPIDCTVQTETFASYQAKVRELESQLSFYPQQENQDVIPETGSILSLVNYPNPFNPSTIISFSLNNSSNVKLTVYNVKGQKVTTLIDKHFENGSHTVTWNGKDNNNKAVASGIYFYKISAGKSSAMKKMLLLK